MENFECFYGGFGLRFLGLDGVSSYKVFNSLKRRVVKHICNKDFTGIKSEIESFVEECNIENEYFSFRYFVLNHVNLFFENITIQKMVIKIIDKNIKSIDLGINI